MQFTSRDIAPMAVGAAVFGAGGGGDAYVTEGMLASLIEKRGPVELIGVDEVGADDPVALLALMGAPHVVNEMLVGTPMLEAVLAHSTREQAAPAAIVPMEMAGLNALVPLIAAAHLGLPCVDADFTGRGVPTLDMTSFLLSNAYPGKQVLVDPLGRSVQVQASSEFSAERLLRPLVEMMGSLTAYTALPLRGADLKRHALGGTLSRCLEVGRAFIEMPGRSLAEIDHVLASLGCARIASGAVIERLSQPEGEETRTAITVASDDASERLTRIDLKNEFHIVTRDGSILATVPDSIVVVDSESWIPLTVEQVGLGQQVTVLALPAHPKWRTSRGIEIAGPRAFGYATDFVPFETLEIEP